MTRRLAIVMDPIESIKIDKDSSFAMLLEAQRRGWALHYVQPGSLGMRGGEAGGRLATLAVADDRVGWFRLGEARWTPLATMDLVLMRRDPPVDADYLHDTQILSAASRAGLRVCNNPTGLRDLNEKLAALLFPQCIPPTLVSREAEAFRAFAAEQGEIVLKTLDGMGGRSIFRSRHGDPNLNVILETLTAEGRHLAMAQRFLPAIAEGDKRILLIDGEPVSHVLARIPQGSEFRGNLAAGGRGEVRPLSERDHWIAAQVGPELKARGMRFVGLDVIGDWLTEINVTSPTCFQEIQQQTGFDVPAMFVDALEAALA